MLEHYRQLFTVTKNKIKFYIIMKMIVKLIFLQILFLLSSFKDFNVHLFRISVTHGKRTLISFEYSESTKRAQLKED